MAAIKFQHKVILIDIINFQLENENKNQFLCLVKAELKFKSTIKVCG